MNDLISRQAVDKIINDLLENDNLQASPSVWHGLHMIKQLLSAQRWNEIHKRPMTDEERKEWSERLGYDIEYDEAYIYSNLPDDGQEVLVSTQYGRVYVDTFYQDDGCYFEESEDMDGILAWMPLPEPYREGNNG